RVQGRLVALPWFIGAGVLYYRKDLLEKYRIPVPRTWDDLAAAAARIQAGERAAGDPRMWGYVFQGRAYEGLTCNALEWLASSGGGTVVDPSGRVSVDNPAAAAALDRAAGWVGTIAPRGVLNYMEEEARGVFQSGHAVFMRNWPYAWGLVQAPGSPVRGKVGMAPLPAGAGGAPAAALGGWSLAVSRFSRHPAEAAALARYLTGAAEQRRRALGGEFLPTYRALYRDPELRRRYPFLPELRAILDGAVARPSAATGWQYNRVSAAFWEAVHETLSGEASGAESLHRLADRLGRIRRRGGW
ncbi:MAG TPA: extracellular solute-binding protein, partial [Holophagaceae bacterium]|nr:extracellular solute-binding protein [Holophagaceae bacterium]